MKKISAVFLGFSFVSCSTFQKMTNSEPQPPKIEFLTETPVVQKRVVSGVVTENDTSSQLKLLKDRLFSASNAKDLQILIDKLNTDYDTLPVDAQYATIQLSVLGCFKDFSIRTRPLFDDFRGGVDVADLFSPSAKKGVKIQEDPTQHLMKLLSTNLQIRLPRVNWQVWQDYFGVAKTTTERTKDIKKFVSQSDLKSYLGRECQPIISKARNRLSQLKNKEIIWNDKILEGPNSYTGETLTEDRFRDKSPDEQVKQIANYEISTELAKLDLALSWMGFYVAYESHAPEVAKYNFNFPEFLYGRAPISLSDKDTSERIQHPDRKRSFRLLESVGAEWMQFSKMALRESFLYMRLAIEQMRQSKIKSESYSEEDLLRMADRLQNLGQTLAGSHPLGLVGPSRQYIEVRLDEFFQKPPTDLKALMATNFDVRTKEKNAWNITAYQRYFPTVKDNDDIKTAKKALVEYLDKLPLSVYLAGVWSFL